MKVRAIWRPLLLQGLFLSENSRAALEQKGKTSHLPVAWVGRGVGKSPPFVAKPGACGTAFQLPRLHTSISLCARDICERGFKMLSLVKVAASFEHALAPAKPVPGRAGVSLKHSSSQSWCSCFFPSQQ